MLRSRSRNSSDAKVVVVGVTLVIFMGVVADAAVVAPAWSVTSENYCDEGTNEANAPIDHGLDISRLGVTRRQLADCDINPASSHP